MDLAKASLGIHIVESGAAKGNYLNTHFVQFIDYFCVYNIVDEHAHTVKTCSQRYSVLVQMGFKILDFQISAGDIVVETGHIIGFGIKKSNFHRNISLLDLTFGTIISIK